ncbi:MAG: Crp/Fnr family transcriptional regulator [Planctomycetota bacterium]|nr:Crp/Fnr family transcriptional regulator [Planctomycetota bacterium]
MDRDTIRSAIAACPMFDGIDDEHLTNLATLSHGHSVPARHLVFRQGDACPGILIVRQGVIRVFKLAPNGKEHVLRLVHQPDAFAEVAVLGEFDCPACAETTEPTEYVVVPAAAFRAMLDQDHAFCRQLLGSVATWVHRMVGLLEDIVLRDASARIAKFLLEQSHHTTGTVAMGGSHKDIALHLNLTPETLSRALRRLSGAKLIEQGNGGLRVLDRESLGHAADGMHPRL